MDYESSLDRAMADVPDIGGDEERLQIPDPETQKDGAFTRIKNVDEIADVLSRETEHLHRFIQRELGTSGKLENGRGRYNGTFSQQDFNAAIDAYVDEYVVPLYDMAYSTTYWLEIIASAFRDRLETPLSVELYAVEVDIDNLIHALEVVEEYADSVLFGYDASNAVATLRRMRADDRDGVSHGPGETDSE